MQALLFPRIPLALLATLALLGGRTALHAQAILPRDRPVPEALIPWIGWATWDDPHRSCPTPSADPRQHRCFWPSRLDLRASPDGAAFTLQVRVFGPAWVPLPGGPESWPLEVRTNGVPAPVVEHRGRPSLPLVAGTYAIEGRYRWREMPQRLPVPPEIGLLSLSLDGQPVPTPAWDAQGALWLRRDGLGETGAKDFLSVKAYSALEDGHPLWFRRELELVVSGKSREEDLGTILPAGWKLASVTAPIPVAVDDTGRLKAQVRAGKFTLRADAFHLDNPAEVRFAAGARPATTEELVAFRARPDFRVLELQGPPPIDVAQTTVPGPWRELPVFRWDTATPFRLVERLRGMGDQKPAGLTIRREWWLDEDGTGLTFRDHLSGTLQQVWRLDAAEGGELGAVRSGDQGQLITRNPRNGAPGVEIRTRSVNLEATGRIPRPAQLSAAGWRADAESLDVTLHLPPGWRLFALFGADWVRGDWLTAWTLLDLFLLLIFSLTLLRLRGWGTALLAFAAYGLAYHEPGAPRYAWIVLLIPLALQPVVPGGWTRRLVLAGRWTATGVLLLLLAPFVASQVQQAIYPQLEPADADSGWFARRRPADHRLARNAPAPAPAEAVDRPAQVALAADAARAVEAGAVRAESERLAGRPASPGIFASANFAYDSQARIQTGPGVPDWTWRAVRFGWNGPVQAAQQVQPLLISQGLERFLTVLRVSLILALAARLIVGRPPGRSPKPGRAPSPSPAAPGTPAAALLLGLLLLSPRPATAQAAGTGDPGAAGAFPSAATLAQLRERLLAVPDAYPHAADLPSVALTLAGDRLVTEAEIHAALQVAVPLPGRLPAWAPVAVTANGQPAAALRRDDGFLWIVLPAGVHQVRVEGRLPGVSDWEWAFLLRPRRVTIEAPGWTVSGVRPDGTPEAQVFFSPQQKSSLGAASYERPEVQAVAQVERTLELGLQWQVRTAVRRLSPPGRAVALRLPLLPGENVLSAGAVARDGFLEVRLGAQETATGWESSLSPTNQLRLATRVGDLWVERWQVIASAVWNVGLDGLAPVFEPNQAGLVPVWQPFPGESVLLSLSRPEALAGATLTIGKGLHTVRVGRRQRVSTLELTLQCSLGGDFPVELPPEAEITRLTHQGRDLPVRKDGDRLLIPVRPGEQSLAVEWKVNRPLGFGADTGTVRLPVPSANLETVLEMPDDRWILWTSGPRRGPAVRFWVILACSLLAALALSRAPLSPLGWVEWMLLAVGLTQVPLPAALLVVGWLFLIAGRGRPGFQDLRPLAYNAGQFLLLLATAVALGILVFAVGEGLLGNPEMFIAGHGSSRTVLRWYQDRAGTTLPRPGGQAVSIWWYRFLMLLWALWLASALIRWLRLGWDHFSTGPLLRRSARKAVPAPATPPPLPPAAPAA